MSGEVILLIVLWLLLIVNAALMVVSRRSLRRAQELLLESKAINEHSIALSDRSRDMARALRHVQGPS